MLNYIIGTLFFAYKEPKTVFLKHESVLSDFQEIEFFALNFSIPICLVWW